MVVLSYFSYLHRQPLETWGKAADNNIVWLTNIYLRRTLEIMIPDFKEKMKDFPDDGTTDTSEDGSEIAVFNDIRIEDPRIAELSNKAGQQVGSKLSVCLRNRLIKV